MKISWDRKLIQYWQVVVSILYSEVGSVYYRMHSVKNNIYHFCIFFFGSTVVRLKIWMYRNYLTKRAIKLQFKALKLNDS